MTKPKIKEIGKGRIERYLNQGTHGVLSPKDYEPKELLELAFEGENQSSKSRSLFAHTDWITPDRAIKLLDYMPNRYNRFKRDSIKKMMATIDDTFVSLGREGSIAIYFWTEQPEIIGDMLKSFNPPDEFSTTEPDQDSWVWDIPESEYFSLVRAWWD